MDYNNNNNIMTTVDESFDNNDDDITYLVETPCGRTAATRIASSVPYEAFVGLLWDAALERDGQVVRKRTISQDDSTIRNVRRRRTMVVMEGRVLGEKEYGRLTTTSVSECSVSLRLRLRGGIDRQNRVGSKFGGGGVSSSQNAERERKERLRQLALESIDLAKDPYLMRNHLGTYECKLCLTLHTNEANYLTHTQGKKHQAGLAKRAAMEKLRQERETQLPMPLVSSSTSRLHQEKKIRIGRPAYQVYKSRDYDTNQRCLSFELKYPEIENTTQPRHRFMSAFEQRVESPPDKRYQYLLVAADPYETVAFKIPNEPIDKGEGRFFTHWDDEEKQFTLTLYFLEPKEESKMNSEN